MKRTVHIFLLVIVAVLPAVTQQTGQQASPGDVRLKAQRKYDPLAGQRHMKDGPLDGLLDSINPANVDYGAKLGAGRQWFVGSTIEDFYFWVVVAEAGTIGFLVLYVFWLFRERGKRLEISVDIVTQLANSYLYTRSRAQDAIRRHNHLIDEYNGIAEKLAKQETAQQRVANSIAASADPGKASGVSAQVTIPDKASAELPPNSRSNSSDEQQPLFPAERETSMTKEQIKKLLDDARRDATAGAKHQVSALNQQVRNLRDQLNQALTKIQTLEKRNTTSVGA